MITYMRTIMHTLFEIRNRIVFIVIVQMIRGILEQENLRQNLLLMNQPRIEKTNFQSPKLEKSRISDPNDHFVWGNLLDMCISEQRYKRKEVYEAIQATVACVQTTSRLWLFKMEDSNNGLYFDMASKLDLANYEISITEHGGEPVQLKTLINRAVSKGLILYSNIDFLPYSPNTSPLNTKFFNLFLGFKVRPSVEINFALIDPIT